MDEIEIRVAALELVILELAPWLDPGAIEDAMAAIRVGLETEISTDEATVRRQALQLLEDGRRRYAGPAGGLQLKRPD